MRQLGLFRIEPPKEVVSREGQPCEVCATACTFMTMVVYLRDGVYHPVCDIPCLTTLLRKLDG